MKEESAQKIIDMLAVNYPNFLPANKVDAAKKQALWHNFLADVHPDDGIKAMVQLIRECKYVPNVAEYLEYVKKAATERLRIEQQNEQQRIKLESKITDAGLKRANDIITAVLREFDGRKE